MLPKKIKREGAGGLFETNEGWKPLIKVIVHVRKIGRILENVPLWAAPRNRTSGKRAINSYNKKGCNSV